MKIIYNNVKHFNFFKYFMNYFRKAKLLLRKKKYQTDQLERTESALDTIEKLIQDLEYTQIEAKVCIYNIYFLCYSFIL